MSRGANVAATSTEARLRFVLVRLARSLRNSGPGLSASQISAMATVDDEGPLRVSALATFEGVDPSVATRVVTSLEAEGLLRRVSDPADGRACLVELSPAGQSVLADLWRSRTEGLGARLERLSETERRHVDAALSALERLARDSD